MSVLKLVFTIHYLHYVHSSIIKCLNYYMAENLWTNCVLGTRGTVLVEKEQVHFIHSWRFVMAHKHWLTRVVSFNNMSARPVRGGFIKIQCICNVSSSVPLGYMHTHVIEYWALECENMSWNPESTLPLLPLANSYGRTIITGVIRKWDIFLLENPR